MCVYVYVYVCVCIYIYIYIYIDHSIPHIECLFVLGFLEKLRRQKTLSKKTYESKKRVIYVDLCTAFRKL